MIEIQLEKTLKLAKGKSLLDVHFFLKKGEIAALYGISGAGKTSILRMIAGLMKPQSGKIIVDNLVWLDTDTGIDYSPQKRQVGMVFQDYALFPNMTIEENLYFALPKNEDKKIIEDIIKIVELEQLRNQKPQLLSKGQQQRVALARTLIQRPKLLLLDEPFSALDDTIRSKLQDYILKVHYLFDLTTVLVSHDVGEILKMTDTIFQIEGGQIAKKGTPKAFFKNENNQIQLYGIIQAIEEIDNLLHIGINYHNQNIKVQVSSGRYKNLKIGDKVELSAHMITPIITKS